MVSLLDAISNGCLSGGDHFRYQSRLVNAQELVIQALTNPSSPQAHTSSSTPDTASEVSSMVMAVDSKVTSASLAKAGARAFAALQLGPKETDSCAQEVQELCDRLLRYADTTDDIEDDEDPMQLVEQLQQAMSRLTSLMVIDGAVRNDNTGRAF